MRTLIHTIAILLLLSPARLAHGQSAPDLTIQRVSDEPRIDGILNDTAWNGTQLDLSGDWMSYSPLHGEKGSQRTDVFIAYDTRYVYVAFHCFDTEPEKIRTTVSRRDNAFNDDWIALSLDSNGTGQSAYHLFVNPSGVQMDALNTTASGEQFEADFVWDSAGRIVEDGYVVEMRVPLQSLRFRSGANVTMGLHFFRRISRASLSVAWPQMLPGQWVFNDPAHIIFRDLERPRLLEILPSITYSHSKVRATADTWNAAVSEANVGASAKYGITSAITLDATVNPDFSQVESDAFQVQVNQRYPIFFSEKRPFFMEGMGLFNLAWGGNMRRTVDTRRIIDPPWGAKLTGSAGRFTFGALSAADQSAPLRRLFNVGRATYGLGGSNYAGAIVADVSDANHRNVAVGGDISYRLTPGLSVTGTVVGTKTTGDALPDTSGMATLVGYSFNNREWNANSEFEHYDRDFQMDGAFYNRTAITNGTAYLERSFFPSDENFWIKRFAISTWHKYGRDRIQDGNESYSEVKFRANLVRQGFAQFQMSRGTEPWQGIGFKSGRKSLLANGQVFRWLNLSADTNWGWSTYYDDEAPFQGRSVSRTVEATFQPTDKLAQYVSYNRFSFDRASDGVDVFDVDIVNSRTSYQFSRQFFSRAILQYDSSARRVLTDFLASYEFTPGTVVHVGYGAIVEKNDITQGRYMSVTRGLFLKASYRWWL